MTAVYELVTKAHQTTNLPLPQSWTSFPPEVREINPCGL